MSGFNNRLDIVGERISEKVQRNYPKYCKERQYQRTYREDVKIQRGFSPTYIYSKSQIEKRERTG